MFSIGLYTFIYYIHLYTYKIYMTYKKKKKTKINETKR